MEFLNPIFIVGPTAVGKSAAALKLAKRLEAEIISLDAMQVYQEVSIASDKPSREVMQELPHHLVNIISVTEEFNVARYSQLAQEALVDIQRRGKTPLFVGGSGMYMAVLLDGIFDGPIGSSPIREKLLEELAVHGPAVLYERLKIQDPQAALRIHPHDAQRIVRALEVGAATGRSLSSLQQNRQGWWGKMPVKIIGLNRPRQELYQRVEMRIDEMFERGLLDEIQGVSKLPLSRSARQIIGVP
ncbi:MAG: tRNA (adenosine(37)-N6)-dimethylallyltransferase MiaA, partial [Candidatus Omnitrophica bacterium]|nr:tRNA (adenosine(37)-N6)-dimethylallyltransferase MiaA [Candidatus Omnitrophota bacterium]